MQGGPAPLWRLLNGVSQASSIGYTDFRTISLAVSAARNLPVAATLERLTCGLTATHVQPVLHLQGPSLRPSYAPLACIALHSPPLARARLCVRLPSACMCRLAEVAAVRLRARLPCSRPAPPPHVPLAARRRARPDQQAYRNRLRNAAAGVLSRGGRGGGAVA